MVEVMKETREKIGIFQRYTGIKATRKPKRFKIGILVDEQWFNIFATDEQLKQIMEPLVVGEQVRVLYRTSYYDGRETYIATSVKPVKQATLEEA